MSIATRTGDQGETSLMYGRRVPKHHLRVEAYGSVDELTSALGLARALSEDSFVTDHILAIQKNLVNLMGELATLPEDLPRYEKDNHPRITAEATTALDELVADLESRGMTFKGWALPGDNPVAAALDVARSTGRRAERKICLLNDGGQLMNTEILVFLNRLSDALWLLARHAGQSSSE